MARLDSLELVESEAGRAPMPWVYILKSTVVAKTYTGSTLNLEKRLADHNKGRSNFTNKYKPWVLVHSEFYENLEDARKREHYLKSSAGRRYIIKNNLIH